MFKLNVKWTVPVVVATVLVLALLVAASTALFNDAPAAAMPDRPNGTEMAATESDWLQDVSPDAAAPSDGTGAGAIDGQSDSAISSRAGTAPNTDVLTRRPLTRAELAQLLATAFDMNPTGLLPFTDVQGHPAENAITAVAAAGVMEGYFDGTFRPRQTVTRAEVAIAVVRALGLENIAAEHPHDEPVFRDVQADHHAYAAVGMAHRLGLYPFHFGTLFAPDEPVEMAEARQMVHAAASLERMAGPIAYTNAPARTVSVQEDERRTIAFTVGEHALIIRNDVTVTAEALRPGDDITIYADRGGELLVAVATGPDSPASTVVSEATKVLRELATPEQLAAIIARDWERAGAELKVSLYNQLLEAGVTAEEATALLEQDWPAVEEHGKQRLTELVSNSVSINPELVRAVLDQDWDAAISHIEVEVLEYVLNYLMETAPAAQ